MGEFKEWGGILVSIGGSLVAWLMADTRSKTRLQYGEEKMNALERNCERDNLQGQAKFGALEVAMAKSEQDRREIHRIIERLDSSKASKELVEAMRSDLGQFKLDMDRRFDRLERLLMEKEKE